MLCDSALRADHQTDRQLVVLGWTPASLSVLLSVTRSSSETQHTAAQVTHLYSFPPTQSISLRQFILMLSKKERCDNLSVVKVILIKNLLSKGTLLRSYAIRRDIRTYI